MSEVKRYFMGAVEMVLASDFDRVTAERDALQLLLNQRDEQVESLEQQRESELRNGQDLQQRLTAADERADVLEQAMHALSALIGLPINGPQASQDALLTIIWDALGEEDAALKQADGGEGVTCTTCMDKKTIRGSGGKFPRDCPDCCNEEG
ncbi:hypothetical protein ACI77I_21885 [Pseudomonas sp. D47]|uniref:hypothetical protein n=1 Tax=Pseudomonas sp. D47 TaxID=3159447 RepID=UPI00387AED13